MISSFLLYLTVTTLTFSAYLSSAASISDRVAQLRLAPTNVDRVKLLEDPDYVFDFLHPPSGVTTGAGGHTASATSANFLGTIENGAAMTIGFLDACGFNTPHTHPRATEFNFAVNGTLMTGQLPENGARFIYNEVPAGSATVFPKGVIHFEQNQGCEPMIFVAAFNNEDPGVLQIAQRFFGLPPAVVGAALNIGVQEVVDIEAWIPDNVALGVDECLKRCGIKRTQQPTTQRQPRVAGNALP